MRPLRPAPVVLLSLVGAAPLGTPSVADAATIEVISGVAQGGCAADHGIDVTGVGNDTIRLDAATGRDIVSGGAGVAFVRVPA